MTRGSRRRRLRHGFEPRSISRTRDRAARRANSSAAGWAAQPASRAPTTLPSGAVAVASTRIGTRLLRDVGRRVQPGLARDRARRRSKCLPPPGKVTPTVQPWHCRGADIRRRGRGRPDRGRASTIRAWRGTETSTRAGTSPTSQRIVWRHDRSRSLSVELSRCIPHRQRSPINKAPTWPLPNC